MPTYLLSYHGGHLADTEEGIAQVMKEFGRWFQEMGPALVDPGKPIGRIGTVGAGASEDGGPNPVRGYTVVNADNFDAALEIARRCPVVLAGRSVEVGETFDPLAAH